MNKNKEINALEELRQLKQNEVDSSKSKEDRNKLGQFSTPRKLADEILIYAKKNIQHKKIKFFDPAFGTGSFYTGLTKSFPAGATALGFELDNDYFSAAKEIWHDDERITLKNTDFTLENPSDFKKSNLLVCNPPYVRHQHLSAEIKNRLKTSVKETTGQEISGLAGLHAYFMIMCHNWIEEDGLAIWLVPSEILEVNYGKSVRDYLTNCVDLERIHFFEQSDEQFSDALVSSCIIVYKKNKPEINSDVQVTLGASFLKPNSTINISTRELSNLNKWSKHLLSNEKIEHSSTAKKLGDVFSIKRGIATGDNNFFIFDKEKALELEIPKKYLRNLLPPSRFLKGDVVRLDSDGFLDTEKKMVLLDIDLPLELIKTQYPKLYSYLSIGIQDGVDQGYLASRRSPWYSQEKRLTPNYFVRYMNRETKSGVMNHSIFIKNEADAVATNSYLMLYEKTDLFSVSDSQNNIWEVLQKGISKALYKYGRTYGGGLVKFEPNELRQVPLT